MKKNPKTEPVLIQETEKGSESPPIVSPTIQPPNISTPTAPHIPPPIASPPLIETPLVPVLPEDGVHPTPVEQKLWAQRIIDGDTFVLNNGERVRLIGIDTTERGECYFTEGTEKLEEFISNQWLRLEKDVSERDRYKRLLRYVYVGDIFVNYELVRQGYAKAYRYEPDVKFADMFQGGKIMLKKRVWGYGALALNIHHRQKKDFLGQ